MGQREAHMAQRMQVVSSFIMTRAQCRRAPGVIETRQGSPNHLGGAALQSSIADQLVS